MIKTGAIIGRVILKNIVTTESIIDKLSPQERAMGDYRPGRFAWVLEKAVVFEEPIPAKGKLSIWDFDMDDEEDLGDYGDGDDEPNGDGPRGREADYAERERMDYYQRYLK